MKILLHTPDFPPWDGGIAAAAYDIAKYLTLLKHEVVVVAHNLTRDDKVWDNKQNFKIVRVRNLNSSVFKYNLLKWKTRNVVAGMKPDILFAFNWRYSGLVCSYVKNKTGIPLVQFYHGNEIFDRRRKKNYWEGLFLAAQKNTDLTLANSQYTAKALQSTLSFPVDINVMPLGVDLEYFKPPEDIDAVKAGLGFSGRKVILTLARIVERKKHMTVIKALPELVKICPEVLYVIAGRGDYKKELESQVERLGLQSYVKFVGFVSSIDKLNYYQACDVYVMTSSSSMESGDVEGFGLTYLEANACGKPVIASNEGGVVDAVKNEINGYLVSPDDSFALHGYLKSLLLDDRKLTSLSKKSLEHVKTQNDWMLIVRSLENKLSIVCSVKN